MNETAGLLGVETARLLKDSRCQVVITGATGWIGRATLALLHALFEKECENHVYCFGSRHQTLALANGIITSIRPLADLEQFDPSGRIMLLHFAFLTKDRVSDLTSEEYIRQNRVISDRIERFVKRVDVCGLMVTSSGAVYDSLRDTKRDSDALIYGRLKYEDELRFSELGRQRGIPVIIPRIFNIAGPYINKYRAYALSSVIDDLLNNDRIQLRAEQPVLRSYLGVTDVVDVCLHWLLAEGGSPPLVLDAAGEEVIEVGDLARRARRLLGRDEKIIDRPPMKTNAENRYVGDGQRFRELAARYHRPLLNLDNLIVSTADYIRANPA